jgi:hypothetical protein
MWLVIIIIMGSNMEIFEARVLEGMFGLELLEYKNIVAQKISQLQL